MVGRMSEMRREAGKQNKAVSSSPKRNNRAAAGREAEELAVQYLLRKGWTVVEKNWRCRAGEIDIIMRDGEEYVLVEVRSKRQSSSYGTAIEAIDARKQQRVRMVAEWYRSAYQLYEAKMRCDAIAVTFHAQGEHPTIQHIVAAF